MEERENEATLGADLRTVIQQVIREYMSAEHTKSEPAHKAELMEERRRREQLEKRLNELVQENEKSRAIAEAAERHSTIRAELQRQGVHKLDLAFKAIRDDVRRSTDGKLVARTETGEVPLVEYVTRFVHDNPEFLPARVGGGSGTTALPRESTWQPSTTIDMEKIRPGMDREELERVRHEVAKLALQSLSGR